MIEDVFNVSKRIVLKSTH